MAQALMIRPGIAAVGVKVGPVKILRVRPTRHFLYLFVRCRCGKSFGHRADRHRIVCFTCGRMAELPSLHTRPPKPRARRAAAAGVKRGRALLARTASRRSRSLPRKSR
jgi:hypothetical protein